MHPKHVLTAWTPLALSAAALLGLGPAANAHAACSSDGQRPPTALVERFLNADCEACWAASDARPVAKGELAIDWIVPGSKGEDAPLSAAANADALQRLTALGRSLPAATDRVRRTTARHAPANAAAKGAASAPRLRVALGLPFNDYIGASIEITPARGGPWTAWLLLVETIPAGTEGTPVERNLARNLLVARWDGSAPTAAGAQPRFFESRPMGIAAGAKAERLRVVGWVEDARGHIRSIGQSVCTPAR